MFFGALVRLWGIQRQVLNGDELHALRIASERSLASILTQYDQDVDNSVPLTALVRLALAGGLRPSELVLRAPVLLAGVALVPALALAAGRVLGKRVACVFAWLLAVSPLLVIYGRILRSYGPILLLAPLAVLAFHRWLEQGKRGDAWLYAVAAPFAAYFHMVSAVFVAAPLAYALLTLRRRPAGPGLRAVVGLGAATALIASLLFVPIAPSLLSFAREKSGEGLWQWSTVWKTLRLQTGVFSPWLAALFWAACVLGTLRLARQRPGLASYLSFLCAAHLAALLLVSPAKYSNVLVFDRYVLLLLPILLLFVACAFGIEESSGGGARGLLGHALPAALGALLVCSGPLTSDKYLHGSFTHHNRFLSFLDRRFASAPEDHSSPPFYARLADDGDARVIVEFPVDYRWSRCNAPYYNQDVHGKEVLISSDLTLYRDARFRWRNAVSSDPSAYLACRADYLVVHLDPGTEERLFQKNALYDEPAWRSLSVRAQALTRDLRARWGEPIFADTETSVWDLRRVRATAATRTR